MSTGKDIFGNLIGTDVQGNADDKNAQGERPKDIKGNTLTDFFGNASGSETTEDAE